MNWSRSSRLRSACCSVSRGCASAARVRGGVPWGVACIALGAFATFASGEWRESPLYFLFDIGLVTLVSAATTLAMAYWQRKRERISFDTPRRWWSARRSPRSPAL